MGLSFNLFVHKSNNFLFSKMKIWKFSSKTYFGYFVSFWRLKHSRNVCISTSIHFLKRTIFLLKILYVMVKVHSRVIDSYTQSITKYHLTNVCKWYLLPYKRSLQIEFKTRSVLSKLLFNVFNISNISHSFHELKNLRNIFNFKLAAFSDLMRGLITSKDIPHI